MGSEKVLYWVEVVVVAVKSPSHDDDKKKGFYCRFVRFRTRRVQIRGLKIKVQNSWLDVYIWTHGLNATSVDIKIMLTICICIYIYINRYKPYFYT